MRFWVLFFSSKSFLSITSINQWPSEGRGLLPGSFLVTGEDARCRWATNEHVGKDRGTMVVYIQYGRVWRKDSAARTTDVSRHLVQFCPAETSAYHAGNISGNWANTTSHCTVLSLDLFSFVQRGGVIIFFDGATDDATPPSYSVVKPCGAASHCARRRPLSRRPPPFAWRSRSPTSRQAANLLDGLLAWILDGTSEKAHPQSPPSSGIRGLASRLAGADPQEAPGAAALWL